MQDVVTALAEGQLELARERTNRAICEVADAEDALERARETLRHMRQAEWRSLSDLHRARRATRA